MFLLRSSSVSDPTRGYLRRQQKLSWDMVPCGWLQMYGMKRCRETPADFKAVDWNKVSSSCSEVLARQPCQTAAGLRAGTVTGLLPISHRLSWDGGNSSISGAQAVGQGVWAAQSSPRGCCGPLDCVVELGVGQQAGQAGWSGCQGWHPSDHISSGFWGHFYLPDRQMEIKVKWNK